MDVDKTVEPTKSVKPTKAAKPAKPAKRAVTAKNADKGTKRKREEVSDKEVDECLESVEDRGKAQEQSEVMMTDEEEAEVAAKLLQDSERFDFLYSQYEKMQVHVEPGAIVTLEWLEQHVAPLLEVAYTPPCSPVAVLPLAEEESNTIPCPFHELTFMEIRYPVDAGKSMYMFCPLPACPVFATAEKSQAVMQELTTNTHDDVRRSLTSFEPLKCKCDLTPKMRISQTQKNFNRVFLTCGQQDRELQCKYFQWMHTPVKKPERPFQPTFGCWPLGAKQKEWNWKPIGGEKQDKPAPFVKASPFVDLTPKQWKTDRAAPKQQQLVPYVSDRAHPADKLLSDLGRDIRAAQEARKEADFIKRHTEENQLLQASGMMPRSLEYHKKWGFGTF